APLLSRVDDRAPLARGVGAVRIAELERDRVLVGRRATHRHAPFVVAHSGTVTDDAPAPRRIALLASLPRRPGGTGQRIERGQTRRRARAGDLPPFAISSPRLILEARPLADVKVRELQPLRLGPPLQGDLGVAVTAPTQD